MAVVVDNDLIEAFAPDRTNQPLDVGISPGRPGGGENLFDPEGPLSLPKTLSAV